MCEGTESPGKCLDLQKGPSHFKTRAGVVERKKKQWVQLDSRGRRGAGHPKFS